MIALSNTSKRKWSPYLLVLPLILSVLVLIIYPLVNSILLSVSKVDNYLSLEQYGHFLAHSFRGQNMTFTLQMVLVNTALTTILSTALALYLRFLDSRHGKITTPLAMITHSIPSFVILLIVILALGNSTLISQVGVYFNQHWPPSVIYFGQGIILMNICFYLPFSAFIMYSKLSGIQKSVIESARDVGASSWQIFRYIILPLSYRELILATIFVLIGNLGSFIAPFFGS